MYTGSGKIDELGRMRVWGGMRAGVMGLMSVWVAGLDSPCTGQFGTMSHMMPPQVQRALEAGALLFSSSEYEQST